MSIEKVNIPVSFIIRGGSKSGKTYLAKSIGKSYKSWNFFNFSTKEKLEKLECVVISGDAIFAGLWGHPVDIDYLDKSDNISIFLTELLEEIEICLKYPILCLVLEGIVFYKYRKEILDFLKDKVMLLNIEMVQMNAYANGICFYYDEKNAYKKIVVQLKEQIIGVERPEIFNNAYQFFPEFLFQKTYSSDSPVKFKKLNISRLDLKNKKVLDIGCNLGYFVFHYSKNGAIADGIDIGLDFIKKASKIKNLLYSQHDINFYCGNILQFKEKNYDMISILSTFHYFREKQREVLEKIHFLLNDDGLLILEAGISSKNKKDEYTEQYTRPGVDLEPCYFPNRKALNTLIKDLYTIEWEGESVSQGGDSIPRSVFHLKKIKNTHSVYTNMRSCNIVSDL